MARKRRLFNLGRCDYSSQPGFQELWSAHPNPNLRSKKLDSFKLWKALGLEIYTGNVLAWHKAYLDTKDWQKEQFQYVPGLQVWLGSGIDFSELPPDKQQTLGRRVTHDEFAEAMKERRILQRRRGLA